jgi:uncharacterized protein involved in exopolysaccharide biosynthesis
MLDSRHSNKAADSAPDRPARRAREAAARPKKPELAPQTHESGEGFVAHEYVTYGDVWRFCTKYWRVIAASTGFGLLVAILYVATATPIFTADAQVLIETDLSHTFREQMSESFASLDTPQVESQLVLIRSERIAKKVVDRLGRLAAPASKPRISNVQRLISSIFGSEPEKPESDRVAGAVRRIRDGLDARREGLSYVINITFRAADPATAATVTNAIADAYVDDQFDTRAQAASQGSKWLEGRINELRKQMNAAALDVQQFKAKRDYRIVSRRDAADPQAAPAENVRPRVEDQNTLEELESRALTYRKIFESYLQAYAESVQRQSYPVTNGRVITRATPPTRKTYPRTSLSLAAGLIAGMLAGFGIAFLMSSWEGKLRFTSGSGKLNSSTRQNRAHGHAKSLLNLPPA